MESVKPNPLGDTPIEKFIVRDKRTVTNATSHDSGESPSGDSGAVNSGDGVPRDAEDAPGDRRSASTASGDQAAEDEASGAKSKVVPNRAEMRRMLKAHGALNDPRWHGFSARSPKQAHRG